ncbi:hypothetical protein E3Q16_02176 [Wallemia mellicola]|uniref:SGF29 C-terminal domain-containing protein n=1 Tax=Wallemia mellicola TaxID=1708541 RepID=A0AB38MW84_9BASI|nr:hypothetical protein E3Q16_02176 [Wallemia mellicola]TIC51211.1 hypothetical protein E3Q05_03196 [Wallemia mellicola]TIC66987.1 hypothetical protein E3Q02_01648 [Wallemia mellicola]
MDAIIGFPLDKRSNWTPGNVDETWDNYFQPYHEKVGLGFVSTVGLISALMTFGLLSYILWHAKFNYDARHPPSVVAANGSLPTFINSAPGAYLVSLFVSHFIYGVGFAIGFQWAATQYISVGPLCDVQGTFLQIGDLGYAFWSGAIAYHTFNLLYFRQSPPNWVNKGILTVCWILQIILPIIGPAAVAYPNRLYDYSGGTWCWISGNSNDEEAIYIGTKVRRKARSLLIYPLVYAILLTPVSIVKIGSMAGWRSPFWLACLSGVMIASSGWLDVLLFLYTRRAFLQEARRAARIRSKSRGQDDMRLGVDGPNNLEEALGLGGVQAKIELNRLDNGAETEQFERSLGNQSDQLKEFIGVIQLEIEKLNGLLQNYNKPIAFKLPENNNSNEDQWILAKILNFIDQSTLNVQDVEPSEDGSPGQVWRTSSNSIINLPSLSSLDKQGHHHSINSLVLGLYPDTTSFYKAIVIKSPDSNNHQYLLRFEDDDAPFQTVSSEFVVNLPKN